MVNSIECFLKVDKNSTNKTMVIKIFLDEISALLVEWLFLKPNCFLKSSLYFVKNSKREEHIHFSYKDF